MKESKYLAIRQQSVVKANELIQKSRFSLSLQQQKIVLYLISQIHPEDEDFKLYEFDIVDFCKVCGIDYESGRNYESLKDQLKKISDKSLWVTLPNGQETLLRWIEKPYIDPGKGKIAIKLDKDMKPYLLQLKKNFTQYELIYTLHFKSKYTIRLYELIKSIHFHELEVYTRRYRLEELRKLLDAEKYERYQNFKQRVLEPSIKEINEYSDKLVEYRPITEGRKVVGIFFAMRSKNSIEVMNVRDKIDEEMGYDSDQISLFDDFDITKEPELSEEEQEIIERIRAGERIAEDIWGRYNE